MKKPTLRLILFTLVLLLLFSLFTSINASGNGDSVSNSDSDSDSVSNSDSDSDSDSIEELLALDEEAEREEQKDEISARSSEAEVLTKAQRIVLELNADNTKRVIEANEFVLVLGYAPWCPRSAELMPQFAEAANVLKELGSSLLMAKLDADRHPKAASALEIKGFPTLLLFVNGVSQVYNGGFSAEEIVIWTRKKTGVPVIRINSVAEAEEFLNKHKTYVIGFFAKFGGRDYEEFVKAATSDNEIQFVEVNDVKVASVLFPNIKPTKRFVGIVKSEPERFTAYEGTSFEKEKLLEFIDYNKFPLVTKLTEMNSVRVYSSPVKLQVMVFAQEDDFRKLLEPLQDIARKFKSKIFFIFIDITEENLAKPFLTLYGLEESKKNVVAAFDNSMSTKFLLESDPMPSNIEEFCSRLLDGTQIRYYKSQPIPENAWFSYVHSLSTYKYRPMRYELKDASIKVIVGKSFDDMVLNSPENVLLEVFTPWCINCETTSKQIEKLAKHFKGSDLVFGRFDAAVNEHPKLQVDDYPTLLFYRAGDKENPIKLSTKKSLKELAKFINKNLKAKSKAVKDEL